MLNYLVASKSGIRCKQSWQLPKSRQTRVGKWCPDKGVGVEITHQVVFHFPLLHRSAVPYIYIYFGGDGEQNKNKLNTAGIYGKDHTGSSLSSSTMNFSEAVVSVRALLPPLFCWISTSPKVRAKCAILLHPQSKHGSTLPRLLRSAEHADPTLCNWYNGAARAKSNLRLQKPLDLQQWTSAPLLWCNRLQT